MRIGVCVDCGETFEHSKVKGFIPARCEPCGDEYQRERNRLKAQRWRDADPARARAMWARENAKRLADPEYRRLKRERERLRLYGITPEEFAAMLAEQDGQCAICRKLPAGRANGGARPDLEACLHIDHNHATGKRRKLLCGDCNTLLGLADENVATLLAAAAYLQDHE